MSSAPVIAAVDGSDDSDRALDWAVDAARRRAAPLRVVHVRQFAAWGQGDVMIADLPEVEGDPVLDQARARIGDATGLAAVEYVAVEGVPSAVLPELGQDAALLVLGSRGRGGFASLLLGSNGVAAARDADCPVVVVPRPDRRATGDGTNAPGPRVVLGVHVDSPDDAALDFAFAEAAGEAARVEVIAAYPWPQQTWSAPGQMMPVPVEQQSVEQETRTLTERFLAPHQERYPGVRTEIRVLPGDAAGHLVAASGGARLVVVGRHRRRLLAPGRMTGSVTQAVLLHAASPIAVVPPAPAGEE
ncbi:universal stress protein [Streptomyces sp. J2-1]|uniref:universal stress protein n=1 Tax=Streptomyces corallincola TaxID=2851888 RepID=UPI001C394C38|nr:universal stress protein [Streptomyces corallincola]MBV2352976.1 universal stress protein [Streptomyces corallincola]